MHSMLNINSRFDHVYLEYDTITGCPRVPTKKKQLSSIWESGAVG